MTPEPTFDVREINALGRVFDDLIVEIGANDSRRVLQTAIRKTLRADVPLVRAATPVASGNLQKSVSLSVRKGKYWTASGWIGWWRRGGDIRYQQKLAVEHGTQYMDAQKVLTNIYELRREAWVKGFVDNL